ncbi:MAG: chemotaxis response regulator protein-glutamate methylesterase [Deltaproteobacteria bacterium]|nr:chemotaxis response regulator protein-glutamate methylesterase [Deltaproteobacteria bacterium]
MVSVLIVDDSSLIRRVLSRELSSDPDIQVLGAAPDPYVAREMIVAQKPNVLTLDLEMPRMDGLTFLDKLMRFYPMPVVIVSSLTPKGSELAIRALSMGAVAVIPKPSSHQATQGMIAELKAAIKMAAGTQFAVGAQLIASNQSPAATPVEKPARPSRPQPQGRVSGNAPQILAIGASTGGTVVLEYLLRAFPGNMPATLIVQHMPAGFTRSFAQRLNNISALEVREAKDGDLVVPGTALVAPGDFHMYLKKSGGRYSVGLSSEDKRNGHRPSVEVLFSSVAKAAGSGALGVILTGMGNDGGAGLLEMRRAGARTLAQDEASCVVFGMPQVAIKMDAVDEIMGPERMSRRIPELLACSAVA